MEELPVVKSNKVTYIVIAVVVIVFVGWFKMRSFSPMSLIPGFGGVVGTSLDGSTTYKSGDGSVTVGGSSLPSGWPTDAPVYSNSTITASVSSNPKTGDNGSMVMFTTPDSIDAVVNFYKTELESKGWVVDQTVSIGIATMLSATKDTRSFAVQISSGDDGKTSVVVGISQAK
ncbi:MAG: hypothetical protein WAW90_02360 [Minisyncoccia bacterium]